MENIRNNSKTSNNKIEEDSPNQIKELNIEIKNTTSINNKNKDNKKIQINPNENENESENLITNTFEKIHITIIASNVKI